MDYKSTVPSKFINSMDSWNFGNCRLRYATCVNQAGCMYLPTRPLSMVQILKGCGVVFMSIKDGIHRLTRECFFSWSTPCLNYSKYCQ